MPYQSVGGSGGRVRVSTLTSDLVLGTQGGTGKSADGLITVRFGYAGQLVGDDEGSNQIPFISSIADQNGDGGRTPLLLFTVNDSETAVGDLQVSASSSNPVLVPSGFVRLDGSGGNRTVQVLSAPGKTGSATIKLTVTDGGGGSASTQFVLTVNVPAPRFVPEIVWAVPSAIVFGTPLGPSQLNASASIPGTFAYTPGAGAMLNAGTHTLSVTFAPGDSESYETVSKTVSLIVTKAPLTIRAENKFMRQGSGLPVLTAIYMGFVNADTREVLDQQVTLSTSASASSVAGTYPITASGAADANYDVTHVNGILQVTTRLLPTLAWSKPATIGYGTALGGAQLNATADVPGTFTYDPPAGTVPPAGQGRVLSARFTPTDGDNFESVTMTVAIDVAKAPLTIRAEDKNKVYGAALPALTATYSGFVNGDTVASLDTAVTLSTTGSVSSNVGSYPITASGAADSNYAIRFEPGTLSVSRAALTVTPKNVKRPLNTANPSLTGTIHGLKNDDLISAVYSTTAATGSPGGVYPITATLVDPNQKLSNYTVTIEQAFLTVQLETRFAGVAQDGYVADALVFFDANKNGILNANEPSTRTDNRGVFDLAILVEAFDSNANGVLDPSEGTIVLTGGVDISTGIALQTVLRAPPGSSVVSPITTLLTAAIESNPALTVAESKARLNLALGLPSSVEVTSFDPIAAAANNDSRATPVLSAGAKIQDTLVQIAALVGSPDAASKAESASAVVQALANSVTAGRSINLDEATVVGSLIEQTATLLGQTLAAAVKDGGAQIIAGANQVKTEIAAAAGTALEAAQELSRTQVAGQAVAAVLEQVVEGTLTMAQAAVQSSREMIISAAETAQVGDVLGVDQRPGTFSFSQSAYPTLGGGTAIPVTILRSEGNLGAVTVVISLKTPSGLAVRTVPVAFGSREMTKTIDLLPQILVTTQLGQQELVPITLALGTESPVGSVLGNPAAATLTVRIPPRIVEQPGGQNVTLGSRITVSVLAGGTPALLYQWQKDSVDLPGQTEASLIIGNAGESDSGRYRVVVRNSYGSAISSEAQVQVVGSPIINTPPASQDVALGSPLRLEVLASGVGLRYEWQKDGGILANATGSVLTRLNMQEADAGEYRVSVRNLAGIVVSSSAFVRVYRPPVFQRHPVDQRIVIGGSATLTAGAEGTGSLSYQWYKENSPIQGATGGVLAINSVKLTDAGAYYVTVTSPFVTVASAPARLFVLVPPSISRHPASQTALAGQDVRFAVEGSGSQPLSYQWFKDGVALAGSRAPELVLKGVQEGDGGRYAVQVSNSYGNATSVQADLVVVVPPTISLQPKSRVAMEGTNLVFEVIARGSPPLKYQWFRNGNAISGATAARLELANVQLSDGGEMSVAVSNPAGRVLSAIAQLTVQRWSGRADFNGDGHSDIVLQDRTGLLGVWSMQGTKMIQARFLEPDSVGDPDWQVVSAGHWNGDGHSDLLFQHANGTLAVWFMNGNSRESIAFLNPSHPGDSGWRVVGVGDLNADGNSDLVFQHIDGTLAAWFMKGVQAEEPRFLDPAHSGDADWQVTALGDFNRDGKDDLVLQHRSGTLGVWLMDQTRMVQASLLRPSHPGHAQWRVAGAADWNRDGQCDLLMQSVMDGSLATWFMDGTKLHQAGFVIPRVPGGTWKAVAPR